MAFNPWTQASGYDLGSFAQEATINLDLPVSIQTGVTYANISGKLPEGLAVRINPLTSTWQIMGTPFLTSSNTKFSFCIRSTNIATKEIADRTFFMTVYTNDKPTFVTPAGDLPVGLGGQYYALDSTFIDFQLDAYDFNTTTGKPLTYFIAESDGELPPGVTMSAEGRISGFIKPKLLISKSDGAGTFDTSIFDAVAFDFGQMPTDGYDSYQYDDVFFDFNVPQHPQTTLSVNYQFRVTLTDGVNLTQRIFRIFVAGTDEFRAGSSALDGYAGKFSADGSFVRTPVWVTTSNLGVFRSNNYITIPVALYDSSNVEFSLSDSSELPPGMQFDPNTGDIFGVVPYQPSVTKSYSFTVVATRTEDFESVSATRTFNLFILGTVTSQIIWNTNNNLGTIPAGFLSTLSVNATSTVGDATVIYELTSGALPTGMSLNLDGELIGTPTQFHNEISGQLGLITWDVQWNKSHNISTATTFDQGRTTFERVYTFGITAQDQYGYSAVTRIFTLTLDTPNTVTYSNIITKPLLIPSQRVEWQSFINNTTIFTPSSVYRPNDPSFGIQTSLNMLVYAGIQTEYAAKYVGAMGLGHKRKRFQFQSIKKAVAIDPITKAEVYEVVYVQMLDPMEPNGKHLPTTIITTNTDPATITADESNMMLTVDSTGYEASNPNTNHYFPNSITNWQTRLSTVGLSERNYLPLWMRSIPTGQKAELGYVLAVPLCFCKPGTADTIITNIKFNGFDFKKIDYTVDRFTISAVLNSNDQVVQGDKYLVFRNDRITV